MHTGTSEKDEVLYDCVRGHNVKEDRNLWAFFLPLQVQGTSADPAPVEKQAICKIMSEKRSSQFFLQNQYKGIEKGAKD